MTIIPVWMLVFKLELNNSILLLLSLKTQTKPKFNPLY